MDDLLTRRLPNDSLLNRRLPQNYKTTNEFRLAPHNFVKWFASDCKRIREDFNDMFRAEAAAREKAGDVSVVFCLTYNDEHIPTAFGHHLADSWDLKRLNKSSRFAKRLLRRFGVELDFVAIAEYGNGGKSHDFVGCRGVGENPHFHCCGWFHKKDGSRLVDSMTPDFYAELVDEIFLAWQGTTERDIVKYGRDKVARSLGLGHVEFSGEIRSPKFGGAYIGKYIGKDIGKLHSACVNDSVAPAIYEKLFQIVSDCLVSLSLNTFYANRLIAFWLRFTTYSLKAFDVEIFYDWFVSRFGHDLFTYDDKFLHSTHDVDFPSLDSDLFEAYTDIFVDFLDKISSRYSPKLRKFHGFGYSLLDGADLVKGTYTISRASREIERFLPASLCRHIWYNHFTLPKCVSSELVDGEYKYKYRPVVRYVLNDCGRAALLDRLRRRINSDVIYIRNKDVSPELIKNAKVVSTIATCLLTFYPTKSVFYDTDFAGMLFDTDRCLDWAISARQFSIHCSFERDTRDVVDIRLYLFRNHRELYDLLREYEHLMYLRSKSKNESDYQYNCYWLRCYDYNY